MKTTKLGVADGSRVARGCDGGRPEIGGRIPLHSFGNRKVRGICRCFEPKRCRADNACVASTIIHQGRKRGCLVAAAPAPPGPIDRPGKGSPATDLEIYVYVFLRSSRRFRMHSGWSSLPASLARRPCVFKRPHQRPKRCNGRSFTPASRRAPLGGTGGGRGFATPDSVFELECQMAGLSSAFRSEFGYVQSRRLPVGHNSAPLPVNLVPQVGYFSFRGKSIDDEPRVGWREDPYSFFIATDKFVGLLVEDKDMSSCSQ